MFENIGGTEILIIVLTVVILFGAIRIPEFAKGVGKGIKELKKTVNDISNDIKIDK